MLAYNFLLLHRFRKHKLTFLLFIFRGLTGEELDESFPRILVFLVKVFEKGREIGVILDSTVLFQFLPLNKPKCVIDLDIIAFLNIFF